MHMPYLPVYLYTYELQQGDMLIGIGRVKAKRLLPAPGDIPGYLWRITIEPITGGLLHKAGYTEPTTLLALPNTEWHARIA
jgi:hypothetical protein